MLSFTIVIVLSLIGILLSYYAYVVEQKTLANPSYKPMCDISDRISCSRPITTGYSRMFGVSNSLIGMLFYVTLLVLAFLQQSTLISIALVLSLLATMFFAYILYVKIRSLCLVCTASYAVNIALFVLWFLI